MLTLSLKPFSTVSSLLHGQQHTDLLLRDMVYILVYIKDLDKAIVALSRLQLQSTSYTCNAAIVAMLLTDKATMALAKS